jgi:WD40 repeat protein
LIPPTPTTIPPTATETAQIITATNLVQQITETTDVPSTTNFQQLSSQLATQSTQELNASNYDLALLLAIEAGSSANTAESIRALHQSLSHPGGTLINLADDYIWQASWNNDGRYVVSAGCDKTGQDDDCQQGMAVIWDAETGLKLFTLRGHTGMVWQAIWNDDESRLVTVGDDHTARVWDAKTGAEKFILSGHGGAVKQAHWSIDGHRLLTVADDNTARLWDLEEQKLVHNFGHSGRVNQAMWNSDESLVLTASDDHTARVWDTVRGRELLIIAGHEGAVRQASWNSDETLILTASDDHTARIWDAETGK